MYANYHTHTFRCGHARGTEEEYIKRAIEGGIKIMGFSDHVPFAFENGREQSYCVQTSEAENYISTLKALREKYKDDIKIHIGFEMEYYPKYFEAMHSYVKSLGAEYLILGQHFVGDPFGYHSMGCQDDPIKLHEYVDCVTAGLKTGAFKYVAHPDMFVYSIDDEIYHEEITRLCKAAKETDTPLEINFLGIRDKRFYPNEPLWRIAGEVGCKAIFGFDAHDIKDAFDGDSIQRAEEIVSKYGLPLVNELEI